ncbi:hypothetical protein [Eubacterium sp. BIOML-A1]|nr:hypothetical protein [Eubacterium sp. BIOML-A1]
MTVWVTTAGAFSETATVTSFSGMTIFHSSTMKLRGIMSTGQEIPLSV